MRNWNNFYESEVENMEQFEAYLWGIETGEPAGSHQGEYQFEAYLWGIETTKSWILRKESVLCLKPTYEELKLSSKNF